MSHLPGPTAALSLASSFCRRFLTTSYAEHSGKHPFEFLPSFYWSSGSITYQRFSFCLQCSITSSINPPKVCNRRSCIVTRPTVSTGLLPNGTCTSQTLIPAGPFTSHRPNSSPLSLFQPSKISPIDEVTSAMNSSRNSNGKPLSQCSATTAFCARIWLDSAYASRWMPFRLLSSHPARLTCIYAAGGCSCRVSQSSGPPRRVEASSVKRAS
mmetsp:Transcript_42990/g.73340  ORF Transcript_42990/g.73340 Transcript_42990/m.73340 type:complete len:212 (-) Transcript_42990:61-696(-)